MAVTFVSSNHCQDAIGQACQQTASGGWQGVYRYPGGLAEVHKTAPDSSVYRVITIVMNGIVSGGRQ